MDLTLLKEYLQSQNLPSYRFNQIAKNYFSARYSSFEEMTDLSKDLRSSLASRFSLYCLSEDSRLTGHNTQKSRLLLADGSLIETVLMDYDNWLTACISSQVGCPMACQFCATGKMGFKRNLTVEEIIDQILYWNHLLYPKYVGRIVFMGMGEPFLNWDNLLAALKTINDKNGLNIGSRKISISTAGIAPKIIEFADLDTEINLAVSLHSPSQKTRSKIMPIAAQYDIETLFEACSHYVKTTKRQLFFEYALMDGINDTTKDCLELIKLLKSNRLYFLNIIPLNRVSGGLKPSQKSNVAAFLQTLDRYQIPYTVRHSFGSEINSACGQLITPGL